MSYPNTYRSRQSKEKQNKNFINYLKSPQTTRNIRQSKKYQKQHQFSHQQKKYQHIASIPQQCYNQDGRISTHYLTDERENIVKYCQKCSIVKASRGFNVEKIQYQEQPAMIINILNNSQKNINKNAKLHQSNTYITQYHTKRMSLVDSLKQNIQYSQLQIYQKNQELHSILMVSESKYNHLLDQVTQYFTQIQQIIEFQKYLTYNKILNQRMKNQECIRLLKASIEDQALKFKLMNEDLEQNKDVINSVSEEKFNLILQKYWDKVNQLPQMLEIEGDVIYYDQMKFPDIKQIISRLNEQIKFPSEEDVQIQSNHLVKKNHQKIHLGVRRPIMKESNKQNRNLDVTSKRQKQKVKPKIVTQQDTIQTMNQNSFNGLSQTMTIQQRLKQTIEDVWRGSDNLVHLDDIKSNPKQILVGNSFSLASSIAIQQFCESSSEEYDNRQIQLASTKKRLKQLNQLVINKELKNKEQKGLNNNKQLNIADLRQYSGKQEDESSLGKYFMMSEGAINDNQTDNEGFTSSNINETMLLGQ